MFRLSSLVAVVIVLTGCVTKQHVKESVDAARVEWKNNDTALARTIGTERSEVLGPVTAQVSAVVAKATTNKNRIKSALDRLTTLTGRVGTLETTDANHTPRLAGAETAATARDTRLRTHDTEIDSLRRALGKAEARLQSLEKKPSPVIPEVPSLDPIDRRITALEKKRDVSVDDLDTRYVAKTDQEQDVDDVLEKYGLRRGDIADLTRRTRSASA